MNACLMGLLSLAKLLDLPYITGSFSDCSERLVPCRAAGAPSRTNKAPQSAYPERSDEKLTSRTFFFCWRIGSRPRNCCICPRVQPHLDMKRHQSSFFHMYLCLLVLHTLPSARKHSCALLHCSLVDENQQALDCSVNYHSASMA